MPAEKQAVRALVAACRPLSCRQSLQMPSSSCDAIAIRKCEASIQHIHVPPCIVITLVTSMNSQPSRTAEPLLGVSTHLMSTGERVLDVTMAG